MYTTPVIDGEVMSSPYNPNHIKDLNTEGPQIYWNKSPNFCEADFSTHGTKRINLEKIINMTM